CRKRDRLQTRFFQSDHTSKSFAFELRLAFTDQYTRKMCQRRKVAASSETSLFRNDRVNAAIQKFQDEVECREPNSRISSRQGICTDQHDGPYSRRVEGIADTNCVANDNISLEQLNLFAADYFVFERTKAGRNSVCDLAAIEQRIHRGRGTVHVGFSFVRKQNIRLARFAVRHRDDLLESKALAIDDNFTHLLIRIPFLIISE